MRRLDLTIKVIRFKEKEEEGVKEEELMKVLRYL
jgi:hypothetical protein